MNRSPDLRDRLRATTRECIVGAAADEVRHRGVAQLTNAAIAARAGVAERTVYRHFATREQLMSAVAAEVSRRLATPPVPDHPAALADYADELFACFEAQPELTREALQSELFAHVRDSKAAERWRALRALIDRHWPALPAQRRALAAANLRFVLAASCWHYHRTSLAMDASTATAAVRHLVACVLAALGPASAGHQEGDARRRRR